MAAWPLREVLLAYVDRLRAGALEAYNHRLLIWAIRDHSKNPKPPKPPRILRD